MRLNRARAIGVAAAAAMLVLATGSTSAAPAKRPYLALGDSIPFGYIAGAGPEYRNPANFSGYPDYVGSALGLRTVDAACPGETTAGFLSATGADNGCRPYRAGHPLHVRYAGTQLAFATAYLKAHRNTSLVTLQLGANDGFLLESSCHLDPSCIAQGVPALIQTVSTNVASILKAIRGMGYKGKLVVVDYYSLNYADLAATQLTSLLNGAVTGAATTYRAQVADAFTAFRNAARGGAPCTAGLLNPNPDPAAAPAAPPSCDVHPSRAGQLLLAAVVEAASRR